MTPDTFNKTGHWLRYLLIILLSALLLYFGKTLFVPMFYGLLIAIVLYPVCKWLEKRKWPRSLAITASLMIVIALFAALIMLFILQVNAFRSDLPGLMEKISPALLQLQLWLEHSFNIPVASQDEWWQNASKNMGSSAGGMITNMLSATAAMFFTLFLVPVYTALFLYNRRTFVLFLEKITGNQYNGQLHRILDQTIHTYFNFIKGMIMVYFIVGVLNSIGLLALGIRHAILFGMLTAIMTIIPYVGIFVSALLPVSVAWITKDSIWYPIGVIAVFAFVQYLEANVIFPRVVAAQLNVSTWATLVAIIAGGILWGVSGMILFIPFVAILKIATDNLEEWKPLNILLSR
jgi:predicted PurR-regulated permease PerM